MSRFSNSSHHFHSTWGVVSLKTEDIIPKFSGLYDYTALCMHTFDSLFYCFGHSCSNRRFSRNAPTTNETIIAHASCHIQCRMHVTVDVAIMCTNSMALRNRLFFLLLIKTVSIFGQAIFCTLNHLLAPAGRNCLNSELK